MYSTWHEVLSGTPQGSSLSPLLFIIFINEMPESLGHFCKLFADDSKLVAVIKNKTDCELLQSDLDKLSRWSHDWKMKFNYEKCKTLYFGPKSRFKTVYNLTDLNTDRKYDLA